MMMKRFLLTMLIVFLVLAGVTVWMNRPQTRLVAWDVPRSAYDPATLRGIVTVEPPVDHYVLCVNGQCRGVGIPPATNGSYEVPVKLAPGDRLTIKACLANNVCAGTDQLEIPRKKWFGIR